MVTDLTRSKLKIAFDKMRKGIPATIAWRARGLHDGTFYHAMRDDPKLKQEYHEAVNEGLEELTESVRTDKSVQGKIFIMGRGHGKRYGKHKEEEVELTLSDETRKIMRDDKATGDQKMKALTNDMYDEKIGLPLFERLANALKLAYPEIGRDQGTTNNPVRVAVVPDNTRLNKIIKTDDE